MGDVTQVRLVSGAGLLVALVAGAAVAQPAGRLALVAVAIAAIAAYALVQANGVVIGVLLLGIMNALPLVNFDDFAAAGSFRPQDVLVIALLAALAWRVFRRGDAPLPRGSTLAIAWGGALFSWWAVTWIRSVVFSDIAPLQAALFGRDFLFFSLMLPLLVVTLERKDLRPLLITLAAGASVAALGEVFVVLSGRALALIVHADIKSEGGLLRLYWPANDLIVALCAFSLGAALLGPTTTLRRIGTGVALLAGFGVILMQTRALYGGVAVSTIAVIGFGLSRSESIARVLRKKLFRVVVAFATLVVLVVLLFPTVFAESTFGTVASRATSGLADASSGSGTVGYRQLLSSQLFELLGGSWVGGLGFLHPSGFFAAGLPAGSIRNPDVGFTNALMTMGLIGTALIYVAPLTGLVIACRRLSGDVASTWSWVHFGAAVWLSTALLTSVTLITLFSDGGLPLTAMVVGIVAVLGRGA